MVLRLAPGTHNAADTHDEVPAGWHEELGWWINADAGSRWRPYWLGILLPAPANVAATLASALTSHHDAGDRGDGPDTCLRAGSAQVLRYRCGDAHVLRELRRATM